MNSNHEIQFQTFINSYIFLHTNAIYRGPLKQMITSRALKHRCLLSLLLSSIIYYNSRIQKIYNHKTTKLRHQHSMQLSFFKQNFAAISILSAAGIQISASLFVIQMCLVLQNCLLQMTGTDRAVYRHRTPSDTDTKSC